jgi:hypothetical protein
MPDPVAAARVSAHTTAPTPRAGGLSPYGVVLVVALVSVDVVLVVVSVVVLVVDVFVVGDGVVSVPVVDVDAPEGGAAVVDVLGAGVVVDDVGAEVVDVLLELGGLVTRPLDCSAESISFCTVETSEATALGVPAAPSAGNAFSCLRSAFSESRSCREGWALSVTTIWSASAVVMHAGQL